MKKLLLSLIFCLIFIFTFGIACSTGRTNNSSGSLSSQNSQESSFSESTQSSVQSNQSSFESSSESLEQSSSQSQSSSFQQLKVIVNFINYDGTVLDYSIIDNGAVPTYNGVVPTKQGDAQYTYTFKGWSDGQNLYTQLPQVTKNTLFTAQFEQSINSYKITFSVNGVTRTQSYNYGEMPVYDGEKEFVSEDVRYSITGWDKQITKVIGEQTYTAILKSDTEVAITFAVEGETLQMSTLVNQSPVFYGVPYKAKETGRTFEFIGWEDQDKNFYPKGETLPVAITEVTYTAIFDSVWETYSVTFKDQDGSVLYIGNVEYGKQAEYKGNAITTTSTAQYEYAFNGWEFDGVVYKTLPTIYGDMTFIAHYDKTLVKYNVTVNYYDINEALLYTVTEKVAYGDSFKIVSPLLTGKVADKPYVLGVVDKAISIEVKYRTCDVWDGQTIATEYTSGSGTSVDPFIITTGAQLAYLAQQSNEQASLTSSADWGTGLYFKLNNDIDLSAGNWTPICYDATNNYKWKYFAGNFDGNGKIINYSIISTTFGVGLFGGLKGTVSNLSIMGNVTAKHRAGGLAYYANGATLTNITNYVNVIVSNTGDIYAGGIVGTAPSAIVTNCTNYGTVNSVGNLVGGIIGSGGGNGSIENCYNYGTVLGATKTGGIVGVGDMTEKTISNCYNYGYIQSTGNYAGGIFGQAKTSGTISTSYNYGTIKGAKYVGGICGTAELVALTQCQNNGVIYATAEQVGGIVGYTTATITKCINNGKVVSAYDYVGGIAGNDSSLAIFDQCVNNGEISGTLNYIGGINGNGKGQYLNCTNNGVVIGESYVGGILGSSKDAIITGCKNYGDVKALDAKTSSAKGFAGIVGWTTYATIITDCHNYGVITAYTNVGGISGYIGASASIVSCTNAGTIVATTSYGDIAGYNNGASIT